MFEDLDACPPPPPTLTPEPPQWSRDADQIIFMWLNVLILFYPPPSSLPLHPKLSDLMDLVKIIFRSDNKVHFYQFVCHGKWLSLAGPHASFYWFPRDSLRWLFSTKQCTNFQNIVLNFSCFNSISIMLKLSWFDLNFQPSSAKNKWKRRPVVLTKLCSSWDSDEYDKLNVKSRNHYFLIFIYWKKR